MKNIIENNSWEKEWIDAGQTDCHILLNKNKTMYIRKDIADKARTNEREAVVQPEIVICSAIRMPDGYVVRGHRHNDAVRVAKGMPRYKDSTVQDQGFVTSRNRFVDRIEGCAIQKAAGIESVHPAEKYLHGELYSEDLY